MLSEVFLFRFFGKEGLRDFKQIFQKFFLLVLVYKIIFIVQFIYLFVCGNYFERMMKVFEINFIY